MAITDIIDGNMPKIKAIFIKVLRPRKRKRDMQKDTASTKNIEIKQVKIAIINVFINMRGKFITLVSVNN